MEYDQLINQMVTAVPSPELTLTSPPHWTHVLDFIASITGSLAWPLGLLMGLLVLREPLIAALSNIKSLRWGDAEATFDHGLREAKESARAIEAESEGVVQPEPVAGLEKVAETSPTGAIVDSWNAVLEAVEQLIQRSAIAPPTTSRTSAASLISMIAQYGLLPPQELHLLQELRALRNRAVHSSPQVITVRQAQEYVVLARRLIGALDAISPTPSSPPSDEFKK